MIQGARMTATAALSASIDTGDETAVSAARQAHASGDKKRQIAHLKEPICTVVLDARSDSVWDVLDDLLGQLFQLSVRQENSPPGCFLSFLTSCLISTPWRLR